MHGSSAANHCINDKMSTQPVCLLKAHDKKVILLKGDWTAQKNSRKELHNSRLAGNLLSTACLEVDQIQANVFSSFPFSHRDCIRTIYDILDVVSYHIFTEDTPSQYKNEKLSG